MLDSDVSLCLYHGSKVESDIVVRGETGWGKTYGNESDIASIIIDVRAANDVERVYLINGDSRVDFAQRCSSARQSGRRRIISKVSFPRCAHRDGPLRLHVIDGIDGRHGGCWCLDQDIQSGREKKFEYVMVSGVFLSSIRQRG